jgi:hypothetical protein
LGGRTSRKTQVARRFFQFRKTFDVDTQQLRANAIKRLKELFDLSSDFAKGTYKFQYTRGKREVLTVKQRQMWARIAAYIAQIMNTIANGIDERQIDKDLALLEKLVNEATAKNDASQRRQENGKEPPAPSAPG